MGTYTSKYTGEEIDNLLGQVENGGGSSSGDTTPTGTIISFMGLVAPNGYLICDGAELNIADYSNLATHFETQFGAKNHFGGDGETTFALPDLRNEFLRGYHGGDSEQLSGEVGIHQDATEIPFMESSTEPRIYASAPGSITNSDKATGTKQAVMYVKCTTYTNPLPTTNYTARPTNVAVLYCIKY